MGGVPATYAGQVGNPRCIAVECAGSPSMVLARTKSSAVYLYGYLSVIQDSVQLYGFRLYGFRLYGFGAFLFCWFVLLGTLFGY